MLRRFIALGTAASVLLAWFAAPSYAAPQKVMAVLSALVDGDGHAEDTINVYDISAIEGGGASNVFTNAGTGFTEPMFSIWLGWEAFAGDVGGGVSTGDRSDPGAIAYNPANGTMYVVEFDSGSAAGGFPGFDPDFNPDSIGDMQGDVDLYRIDYQEILKDYVDNARPKGVIYAPDRMPITISNETFLDTSGSTLFDGVIDGVGHGVPHAASVNGAFPGIGATINIANAIEKVGEVARTQQDGTVGSFFDQEIDFINPEKILMLGTATKSTGPSEDFQMRVLTRVSTSQGFATIDSNGADNVVGTADDQVGGRNGLAGSPTASVITQSWESVVATTNGLLGGPLAQLGLDASGTPSKSDPNGLAFVRQTGTLGFWVVESDSSDQISLDSNNPVTEPGKEDNSGDDLAYYELDLSGAVPKVTRKDLEGLTPGDAYSTAETPTSDATTDDGDIEFIVVDKDGNLIVGETGYFNVTPGQFTAPKGFGTDLGNPATDQTAEEPRVFTLGIDDYSGATVDTSGTGIEDTASWTLNGEVPVSGGNDNDDYVTDIRRVGYDKGTGYIYIIDEDGDEEAGAVITDPEDVYVFDPATGTIVYFELGATNLGFYNSDSIQIFERGDINDDGEATGADLAVLSAWIADPTIGGTVSSAVGQEWFDLTGDGLLNNDDLVELQTILGITIVAGDFDLDGDVDDDDLTVWEAGYGTTYNGDDFLDWQENLGFTSPLAGNSAVPEPSTVALLALSLGLISLRSRRSRG